MDPETYGASVTLAALLPALPARASVLDAGCGRGALARLLLESGFQVSAIDQNPEAVTAARGKGVDTRACDLFAFEAEPFDALVFSRVLHHLKPLAAALEKARALLKPAGLLFVEDFGWERVDAATATWFYGLEGVLKAAGMLAGDFTRKEAEAPLERWQEHHKHHSVHTGGTLRRALAEQLRLEAEASPPYLFRYAASKLPETARGGALLQSLHV